MSDITAVETGGIAETIQREARSGKLALPPLPEVATRLLAMLRDEEHADLGSIAALMQKDPAIAASVLRIANSAWFGGLPSLSDLSPALNRLGLRQVGMLVTAIAHRGHFRSSDPQRLAVLRVLWDQALASALAARHLAGLGDGDRTEAYLAGLLHDVGKLLVLKGLDELEARTRRAPLPSMAVSTLMELLHAELGHGTLKAWKIQEPIATVALRHHQDAAPDETLLLRVQAGDAIARRLGARTAEDRAINLLAVRPIQMLHLSDPEITSITVAVEDELAEARSMFE